MYSARCNHYRKIFFYFFSNWAPTVIYLFLLSIFCSLSSLRHQGPVLVISGQNLIRQAACFHYLCDKNLNSCVPRIIVLMVFLSHFPKRLLSSSPGLVLLSQLHTYHIFPVTIEVNSSQNIFSRKSDSRLSTVFQAFHH